MWNSKDLEMQLETVMENLNLINSSAMNDILDVSHKDDGEGYDFQAYDDGAYSKEKLLQNLKRN